MTLPLESSLAVPRAGGLLVQLNGERRVPIDIRRTATHIARHFPTVGDVEGASLLGVLAKDDSLFEHPRNCQGREDCCMDRPLAYRRLRCIQ